MCGWPQKCSPRKSPYFLAGRGSKTILLCFMRLLMKALPQQGKRTRYIPRDRTALYDVIKVIPIIIRLSVRSTWPYLRSVCPIFLTKVVPSKWPIWRNPAFCTKSWLQPQVKNLGFFKRCDSNYTIEITHKNDLNHSAKSLAYAYLIYKQTNHDNPRCAIN